MSQQDPEDEAQLQSRSLPETILDDNGDLKLVVGGADGESTRQIFIVCSRTLSRASTVFKRMLYGQFKESASTSRAEGQWTVHLPEDDPATMKLALAILHALFDRVPGTLDLNQLYELLILLDKWDMMLIVKPWAKIWFKKIRRIGNEQPLEELRYMWVAWQVGARSHLDDLARSHARRLCKDGTLRESPGIKYTEYPVREVPGLFGR